MDRLSIILTLLAAFVLMGGSVITVLVIGLYTWQSVLGAALAGLLLAWPAAYLISRPIKRKTPHWRLQGGKPGAPSANRTDYQETQAANR